MTGILDYWLRLQRSEELLGLGTATSREQAFENLFEVFQSYVRLEMPELIV
jgi:hypothetical protein